MTYKHNKKWRLLHPQTRQTGTRNYYRKTQAAPNRHKIWTTAEMDIITEHDKPPDSVLAAQLGRSVQAIQIKRSKLKATQ